MDHPANQSRTPKGQSAVEYLFLVAAVILVILAFLRPSGYFHNKIEETLNADVDMVDVMVNEFTILP